MSLWKSGPSATSSDGKPLARAALYQSGRRSHLQSHHEPYSYTAILGTHVNTIEATSVRPSSASLSSLGCLEISSTPPLFLPPGLHTLDPLLPRPGPRPHIMPRTLPHRQIPESINPETRGRSPMPILPITACHACLSGSGCEGSDWDRLESVVPPPICK